MKSIGPFGASTLGLVDMHCHFFPEELEGFSAPDGDDRWPHLILERDEQQGKVMRGDKLLIAVDRTCWDMDARLSEMDNLGIACHVISPMPVSLTYWADVDDACAFARATNDWLSREVHQANGRILGLGTVPLQDCESSISEMERVIGELGLSGLEIGTVVNGRELDAPEFRPFFKAAEALEVPLLVHPVARYHGLTMPRCTSERGTFATELLTDSTLAATALVFGGVLEDCPNLRVCLSHGGGTFCWVYPRLRYWECRTSSRPDATGRELDGRVGKMFVDSLVFNPDHIALLGSLHGIDHILPGSDYPLLPASDTNPTAILDAALERNVCTFSEIDQIKAYNPRQFLARSLNMVRP